MYTKRATNKSNASKCTHALDAVSAVAKNPESKLTDLFNIPSPGFIITRRTASKTSVDVKDAYAAAR
jgi:hypothetical protein